MSSAAKLIKESRKIVVKIGSNTLSTEKGEFNYKRLHNLVEQFVELMEQGKQILIVTSGAGICGTAAINKWKRKSDINYKQALCSIGQVELMLGYKELFKEYNIHVGQMLLCNDDFGNPSRSLHIRNTLFTLIDEGVVPIINENDSVTVDEIRIGDNDTLSAYTASLWGADLLILLSDIDGVYDKNPKEYADAKLIEVIRDIDKAVKTIQIGDTNSFGTGGIATKLSAAKIVNKVGIPMIIMNGFKEDVLRKISKEEEKATVFLPE
ncbi:MAG: glutamate 5-kinase [Clostridia bacterium]|nr:glutamate 5-kinase [Clostridia bacterium]